MSNSSIDDTVSSVSSDSGAQEAAWPSTAYAWYVVIVLLLAFTVSFIDRHILSLLVQPIREDLALSDTQFSLLVGFAFAIFYTVMGVPIARLADRKSRKIIIMVGISVWCVMTALCGLAKNFWHLFFARMGIGVGEAALSPSAYSMISDYFPPERLGRAISIYAMGVYLGAGLAMIASSVLVRIISEMPVISLPIVGTLRSWQLVFFAVGIPGLLLVPLMFTVKEPIRRGLAATNPGAKKENSVSLTELFGFLYKNSKTLLAVIFGFSLIGLTSVGFMAWTPEFLRRTYGMDISDAGLIYGLFLFFIGGLGVYFGGWFADTLLKRGFKDAALRAAAFGVLFKVPFVILTPLMPNQAGGIAMLGMTVFVLAMTQGLSPTVIQLITPNQMRAQVMAIYFLLANLLAIGLGPSIYAMVTDYGFGYDDALRYSLAIVSGATCCIAVLLLWWGLRHYQDSLKRAKEWS